MVDMNLILYSAIGAAILAAIALIGSNWSTIASLFSGEWARSLERARQQKAARERLYGYAPVNTSTPVMSRDDWQTNADEQTDEQTDRVSEADQWMDRVQLDRTKTALIEVLVYSGWDVAQIRSVLKGDNGALGAEIDAARKRLGIAPEPPRTILVRDNGGPARAIPITDPDYPMEPLRA